MVCAAECVLQAAHGVCVLVTALMHCTGPLVHMHACVRPGFGECVGALRKHLSCLFIACCIQQGSICLT